MYVLFAIFFPPQLTDLGLKSVDKFLIAHKLDTLYVAPEMMVMVTVVTVVSEHSAVINSADSRVDVSESVVDNFAIPGMHNLFRAPASPLFGQMGDIFGGMS
jgi:hypothetical protein